ncbi:hypothetical protein GH714_015649 [Hevea brasiliensis]|uniref:Transposase MuDR plant domain-containing protein n=1 Tax=Hevea brasiliensis TaxID=3981 RepID=A0A6A6NHI0_HEVBR|nr:hypothetical protein GH714_015649 [Hevea brasiliensis]
MMSLLMQYKRKVAFEKEDVDIGHGLGLEDVSGLQNESRKHGYISDYDDSEDDGFETPDNNDKNDIDIGRKKRKRNLVYNPLCNHANINFEVGMIFEGPQQFRDCITKYGIINGYDIQCRISDELRLEAKCFGNCPWSIYISKPRGERTYHVRSHNGNNSCFRSLANRLATSDWLAKEFLQRLMRSLDYRVADMMNDLREKYALTVNKWLCYRARTEALFFERPCIYLDGCFLKKGLGGTLLSAVSRDRNNQMFPMSWYLVEGENEESWKWFLQRLFEDVNIIDGLGLTVGLAKAIKELVPHTKHQNCAKHVYANWKKLHKERKGFGVFVSEANGSIYARMLGGTTVNIVHGQSQLQQLLEVYKLENNANHHSL